MLVWLTAERCTHAQGFWLHKSDWYYSDWHPGNRNSLIFYDKGFLLLITFDDLAENWSWWHSSFMSKHTQYYTTMSQYWPLCTEFLEINFRWSFSTAILIISVPPLNTCWHAKLCHLSALFSASLLLPPSLSSSLWCTANDFPNCVFHQRITARKHHAVFNGSVTAEFLQTG